MGAGDNWLQTATGGLAFVDFPAGSEIKIEDIAAALSRVCRFGGHLRADVPLYSVAQHSVLVSHLCPPELALVGLLHDSAEAYLGDVIRPLKLHLPDYRDLEHVWERELGHRFGVGDLLADLPPAVKLADLQALATERRDLLSDGPGHRRWSAGAEPSPFPLVAMGQAEAERSFLRRFEELRAK